MGILTSLRDSQTQSHVDRTGQALRLQTEASPHQAGLLLSPGLGQDPGWIWQDKGEAEVLQSRQRFEGSREGRNEGLCAVQLYRSSHIPRSCGILQSSLQTRLPQI